MHSCPEFACDEPFWQTEHFQNIDCLNCPAVQFTISQPHSYSGIIYSLGEWKPSPNPPPTLPCMARFCVYVHGFPEYRVDFKDIADERAFEAMEREHFSSSNHDYFQDKRHPFILNIDLKSFSTSLCKILLAHIATLEGFNTKLKHAGFYYSKARNPRWSFGTPDQIEPERLLAWKLSKPRRRRAHTEGQAAHFLRVFECLNSHCDIVAQPTQYGFALCLPVDEYSVTVSQNGLHSGSIKSYGYSSKNAHFYDILMDDFPLYVCHFESDVKDFNAILTKHFPPRHDKTLILTEEKLNPFQLKIDDSACLSTLPLEILAHIAALKAVDIELISAGFVRPRTHSCHDNWLLGSSRKRKRAFDVVKYKVLWENDRLLFNNVQRLLPVLFEVVCTDVFKLVLQFVA